MLKSTIFLIILIIAGFTAARAQTPTPTPDTLELEKARADRLQARYNDFAQLTRYREANAKTPAPAKDETRVVFIGDSITDFWKLNEFFPNQSFINRGISAQTTPQMLVRFRPDVIALKPKVVVILAGTNDIGGITGAETLETIEGNLASMAELAQAHGVSVVLASVLPVSDYNKNKAGEAIVRTIQRPPAQILALNQWTKNYAAQNGAVYLDYFSALVDAQGFMKAELARDGLHPNAKGYEVMKPLAENAISAALKKKQKNRK
jgi:lysophospholipase L1-like esterase